MDGHRGTSSPSDNGTAEIQSLKRTRRSKKDDTENATDGTTLSGRLLKTKNNVKTDVSVRVSGFSRTSREVEQPMSSSNQTSDDFDIFSIASIKSVIGERITQDSSPSARSRSSQQQTHPLSSQSTAVSSEALPKKKPDILYPSLANDRMMELESLEDLGLYKYQKSLNCLWPMRKIRTLTGLKKETLDILKKLNVLEDFKIKPSATILAALPADDNEMWWIYRLGPKDQFIPYTHEKERQKIDKELLKIKDGSDTSANVLRIKLRKAMNRMETMIALFHKNHPVEPDPLPSTEDDAAKTFDDSRRNVKREKLTGEFEEAQPVEFKPGMEILLKSLGNGRRIRITEISLVESTGVHEVLLANDLHLVDEYQVCAGENTKFFPYSELRSISTFICGKDGTTLSETVQNILSQHKGEIDNLHQEHKLLKTAFGEDEEL